VPNADHPDPQPLYVRVQVAWRERDVDTLVSALGDEVEASLAVSYLGRMGAVSAVPAILPLLSADDPHQRAGAATALGQLDASVACPRLAELARSDEVPWVRSCATEAVGRLSCGDAGTLLLDALADPDIRVRRIAVVSLMDKGHHEAIPQLRTARRREHWYSKRIYSKAIRRLKRHAGRATAGQGDR
jgi:HEAT repeat protein